MNIPENLKYAQSHEWVRVEGDCALVGISDHAQAELTDIVYVELPRVGATVAVGSRVGTVESVKTASEIYAPVSGEIVEVNEGVAGVPALLNSAPYDAWILKIRMSNPAELGSLKDAASYRAQIGA